MYRYNILNLCLQKKNILYSLQWNYCCKKLHKYNNAKEHNFCEKEKLDGCFTSLKKVNYNKLHVCNATGEGM